MCIDTYMYTRCMNYEILNFFLFLRFTAFVSNFTQIFHYSLSFIFLQNDASGEKLKDLAIEMKLTPSALEYIKTKVPKKGFVLLYHKLFVSSFEGCFCFSSGFLK